MGFEVVCCLGDSIANGYWDDRGLGWFGRLQEKLAAARPGGFGFNNLAMSGDRTLDVYHRLCGEALSREPDILVIAVGVNDLIRWQTPDGPTDQSPQARAEVWQRLLALATHNVKKVLVVGLIPQAEDRYPTTGYDNVTPMWHTNTDTQAYNADLAAWCAAREVPFVDIFDMWIVQDYQALLADGGHPNGRGHALLADQVFEAMHQQGWV